MLCFHKYPNMNTTNKRFERFANSIKDTWRIKQLISINQPPKQDLNFKMILIDHHDVDEIGVILWLPCHFMCLWEEFL
jgi:hypothetical protein